MAGLFGSIFGLDPYSISDLMSLDDGRTSKSSSLSVNLEGVFHRVQKESIWDKIKKFFTRNKVSINLYHLDIKYKVNCPSGSTYTVLIELNPNFNSNKFLENPIKVYCQCEDFKYRCAYDLNKRKNLLRNNKIDTSLGQALTDSPKKGFKTSPACKHVYACLLDLKKNYKTILKSL